MKAWGCGGPGVERQRGAGTPWRTDTSLQASEAPQGARGGWFQTTVVTHCGEGASSRISGLWLRGGQ